jgi:dethiobiotin synthetase
MNQFILAGIGTEIGKTVVASILTEALEADYWKPVQAGGLDFSDTLMVKSLVSNKKSKFHPEAFRLSQPLSPHAAAAIDGIKINMKDFEMPQTNNGLIVELAGGLMVPLNDRMTNMNLIQWLGLQVILVSKNYLGSINHTLLSIEALQKQQTIIKGIIFNGESNPASEDFILNYTGVRCLGRVSWEEKLTKEVIKEKATAFKKL